MSSSSSETPEGAGPVILLIRSLDTGGTERQLVHLAIGLKRRGHHVVVALLYRGGAFEPALVEEGIELLHLGKRHRWDLVGPLRALVAALRRHRPCAVYSFLPAGNSFAALARSLAPQHRLVWGVRAANMELAQYGRAARVAYALEQALSGIPDLIIANSQAARDHAERRGFPERSMVVIPNGIDVDRFRPDPGMRRRMRAAWRLPQDAPVIGVLARIDPIKDYPTFLTAAAQAARRRPDLRFLCIGDGDPAYAAGIKAMAASLGLDGRLTWAGTADAPSALNALDILCSSSAGESFSNAIAEGMATGLPCVVTDVGDSALMVGDTGWVVPARDPRALAAALVEAVEAQPSDHGCRARARIAENFSIARMVDQTAAQLFRDAPAGR